MILLGVVFIFWRLFGGGPSEFNILIALVSGILFKIMGISNDLSGLKEKVKGLENRFNAMALDFKSHVKHK